MKSVLLIGLGRFGMNLVHKLNELGHEVMAIDINEERVNDALPFVTNAQIGDTTDREFLESLGVRNFDIVIVAIAHDFESAMITTNTVKEMGAPKVISRACSDIQEKLLKKIGADIVVYPEKQVAHWTALRYTLDTVFDYFELSDGFAIYEVSVPDNWQNKTIVDLNIRKKYHLNILAIKEADGRLNVMVASETKFAKGQRLLVLGKTEDIRKCFKV